MCGIMAYIGQSEAFPILIGGLKKLEYRGYDSAGVATVNGSVHLLKKEGKVQNLLACSTTKDVSGKIGIGHTRWATHGLANDANAHPHQSQSGSITLVHNGIIENYQSLKDMLMRHGFSFQSDTDSEVLVQLIEWYKLKYNLETQEALGRALQDVQGSFAIALYDKSSPNHLLAVRRQSPLVIGIGNSEFVISSDSMTFDEETKQIVYLDEDVIAKLSQSESASFFNLDNQLVEQNPVHFDYSKYSVSMGNFESFTLKEIFEQNLSVSRTLMKYLDGDGMSQQLRAIGPMLEGIDRIIITACGTSWHSGLVAEYLIERYAKMNVEVEYASEFRYKCHTLTKRDLVVGISQSGETADTISALEIAKSKGIHTLAIVNGDRSSVARMVDHTIYLDAGMEIGVASTKAFTSQLSAALILTLIIGQHRNSISRVDQQQLISELHKLPGYISSALSYTERVIKGISYEIAECKSALYLGRGISYPIAIEGALKLKEISYIHAEGYPSGEMKHGPIALVEQGLPVIAIINDEETAAKIISNIQEVKARKATVIVVKNENLSIPDGLADHIINTPNAPQYLNPVIQSVPLQLLAYYVAKLRGCDIDQPRNLAKSVTVE